MTNNTCSKKIEWLSILQGWSMLLVVIGHVVLTDDMYDPQYPISSYLYNVIYSFHMPLFIFISGWLLYYTSIARSRSYKEVILSKLKRLLIPFYFFTCLTVLIKIILVQFVKRQVDINELINTFVLYSSNPLKELWFIVVLFVMMIGYPLYTVMVKTLWGEILMLVLGVLIFFFCPTDIHILFFHKLIYLFFFFLLGIIVAHHRLIERFNLPIAGSIAFFLFVILNILNIFNTEHYVLINFINSFTGIFFSVSLCLFLAKWLPSSFSSFRDYTFQIYLIGMFPQMALRVLYLRSDLEHIYWLLFFTSIILGLYIPVIISKYLKRHPTIFNWGFGL